MEEMGTLPQREAVGHGTQDYNEDGLGGTCDEK